MVFQFQSSLGAVSVMLGTLSVLLMAGLLVALIQNKMRGATFVIGLFVSMILSCGALFLMAQDRSDSNAAFSQQLMAEYHATSSRPLSDIKKDFSRYHEANAIFTQDGKETPVSIQLVSGDDKKVTMVFTVMNDKSLYPKPSK